MTQPGDLYRLCVADTVTGVVQFDLPTPTAAPSWTRQISDAGQLGAAIPLAPRLDDDTLTRLQQNQRNTLLWCYGNGILQGGVIYDTVGDDSQEPPTLQISTDTIWEFLTKKRYVRNLGKDLTDPAGDVIFSATSPDPANRLLSWGSVARRVVEITLGTTVDPRYALPILLPDPTSGTATATYTAADTHSVGDVVTTAVEGSPAPEIEFAPVWADSAHDRFVWAMRTSDDGARLGQLGYPHGFDYKQCCVDFNENTDGTNDASVAISKGQDSRQSDGTGALAWAIASDFSLPNAGWPVLEAVDLSHGTETSNTVLQGYATSIIQSSNVRTATMTIRNDGRNPDGEVSSPSIDEIDIGDTCVLGIDALTPHPTLPPGQYALRITAMTNGEDILTSELTVQILGAVQ